MKKMIALFFLGALSACQEGPSTKCVVTERDNRLPCIHGRCLFDYTCLESDSTVRQTSSINWYEIGDTIGVWTADKRK